MSATEAQADIGGHPTVSGVRHCGWCLDALPPLSPSNMQAHNCPCCLCAYKPPLSGRPDR